MNKTTEFDFGNNEVATAYDNILVPAIFEPWANDLVRENGPWKGLTVLDLACGTGALTKKIVKQTMPEGHVFAVDINPHMLAIAKEQCATWEPYVTFCEGSADHIHCPDFSVDVVVCQQGFQFFPDKLMAAKEIYRVLKPGGKVILSTWCSVKECEVFGLICEALEELEEHDIAQMMRMPFDFLSQEELKSYFEQSGFSNVATNKKSMPLSFPEDGNHAYQVAFATPIAPKLAALPQIKQSLLNSLLLKKSERFNHGEGNQLGQMVSNIIIATK